MNCRVGVMEQWQQRKKRPQKNTFGIIHDVQNY